MSAIEVKKDIVIIVGKKTDKKNLYKLDGVVLYDAFCLSSNTPYLLQSNSLKRIQLKDDSIIYLCGHGNQYFQTISGIKIKEIAQELQKIKGLVTSSATIMIMACYGKYMVKEFEKELNNETLVVKAFSYNTTLVADYNGKCYVEDKLIYDYNKQSKVQREQKCKALFVNARKNYAVRFKDYYDKFGYIIEHNNKNSMSKR